MPLMQRGWTISAIARDMRSAEQYSLRTILAAQQSSVAGDDGEADQRVS